jgi:nitrogenase molybdenum-cofactor synthesis protein NifE
MEPILKEREKQITVKKGNCEVVDCGKASVAGSVSQRACVFCGSRVVLYPIADALHLVHGPIGFAAYTWDIRGALSSGPQLHRLSFSTDLREKHVVFGGESRLYNALTQLIKKYHPQAAFVYSTCIVGIIGDDIEAVCKKVSKENGIDVIPVQAEGFSGTKKDGYKIACEALMKIIDSGKSTGTKIPNSINILGDFNLAGELWILSNYYAKMGVNVVAKFTGDGRIADIKQAKSAMLNVVQCSGSMMSLAKSMKEKYGIPFIRVSYFGIEDMSQALYDTADFFNSTVMANKARQLVTEEISKLIPALKPFREKLEGKKAAIYVGGAFKAVSLIKALRLLGIKTVIAGSQTGNSDDYNMIQQVCDEGTIIVDDSNPMELQNFIRKTGADIFIGGVKERPIAFKLGIGFCDHNHERKEALAGYKGMMNFAKEVYATINSPVWQFVKNRKIIKN